MSIVGLILVLVIAGVVLAYVPMDARIKTIIIVVLALVTCGGYDDDVRPVASVRVRLGAEESAPIRLSPVRAAAASA